MLSQMLVDSLLNGFLRNVTHDLLLHLPTLEYEQRRDAAHAITHGRGAVVVDVHFADLDSALIILRQLLHNRSNGAARSAPRGPEVHQDWSLGLENILVEIRICYFKYSVACHEFLHRHTRSGPTQLNSIKAHPCDGPANNTCIGCRGSCRSRKGQGFRPSGQAQPIRSLPPGTKKNVLNFSV